jgi:hypothetical protein
MEDEQEVVLSVNAIDFLHYDGQLIYNFQIQFGNHLNWIISKTYEHFCSLHEELGRSYGTSVLPYLTGPVRPWARNSTSTGDDRLPKLEAYLQEVIARWPLWEPSIFVVRVPNPDDLSKRNGVVVNQFLFVFLEFEQHLILPGDDELLVLDVAEDMEAAMSASEPAAVHEVSEPHVDEFNEVLHRESQTATRPLDTPPPEHVPQPPMHHEDKGEDLALRELQTEASNVTNQIFLQIRNYTIYKDDRIDYHVHVTILGHHWILMKRYSEFAEFHKRLREVYGVHQIPPVEESKVPAWRKLSPETGLMRQKFFNSYLRAVIVSVDTWDPPNLVTRFSVSDSSSNSITDKSDVCVCVNQLLFDFLCFERHIHEFKVTQAEEALDKQMHSAMRLLSNEAKDVLERNRVLEFQAKVAAVLAKRRARLDPFPAAMFDELTAHVAAMDDDRDISALLLRVVASGRFSHDDPRSPRHAEEGRLPVAADYPFNSGAGNNRLQLPLASFLPPSPPSSAIHSPRDSPGRKGHSSRKGYSPAPSAAASTGASKTIAETAVVGFTSAQLAKLCRVLYFEDTRVETIRLFAPLLTDVDAVDDVTGTLLYNWDALRSEVLASIVS